MARTGSVLPRPGGAAAPPGGGPTRTLVAIAILAAASGASAQAPVPPSRPGTAVITGQLKTVEGKPADARAQADVTRKGQGRWARLRAARRGEWLIAPSCTHAHRSRAQRHLLGCRIGLGYRWARPTRMSLSRRYAGSCLP